MRYRDLIDPKISDPEIIDEEIIEEAGEPAWTDFLVYGSFTDPDTGENAIIVRMPQGRVPWTKRIVPAINRLVRPWFPPDWREANRKARQRNRENPYYWTLSGDPGDPNAGLWNTTKHSHYLWDGASLSRVRTV